MAPRLPTITPKHTDGQLIRTRPVMINASTVNQEAMILQAETDAIEISQTLRRASGLVLKSLEQQMKEVNLRYEALCERREKLQAELSATQLTDTAIQDLVEFAQDVFVGIENADFQTKRNNLEMLKVKVVVESGKFTIHCLAGEISGDIRKLPKVTAMGVVNDLRSPGIILPECRFQSAPLPLAK